MSSYREGQEPHAPAGNPPGDATAGPGASEGGPTTPPPTTPPTSAPPAYGGQAGHPHQTTSQMPPVPGPWPGGQSQHRTPLGGVGRISLRDSLRSTEFWVLVVVSLALLIAAAASDSDGVDGFGAEDAWWYVTLLAAAYILSRGLAKLGRRDDDGR